MKGRRGVTVALLGISLLAVIMGTNGIPYMLRKPIVLEVNGERLSVDSVQLNGTTYIPLPWRPEPPWTT